MMNVVLALVIGEVFVVAGYALWVTWQGRHTTREVCRLLQLLRPLERHRGRGPRTADVVRAGETAGRSLLRAMGVRDERP